MCRRGKSDMRLTVSQYREMLKVDTGLPKKARSRIKRIVKRTAARSGVVGAAYRKSWHANAV